MLKFKTKECHNCGYVIMQQSKPWNGKPDNKDPNLLLEKCPFCKSDFHFGENIEFGAGCLTVVENKVYAKYIMGNLEKEQLYQTRIQNELEELDKEIKIQEKEEQVKKAIKQQEINNQNLPKCPTCSSTNIEKLSSFDKAAGAVMFGLFSKTARSQFKCRNCGYKW